MYYSRFSKTENKGEFNARLKTIVLSWYNFLEGNRIEDVKLNLGIHEFAHAIHFNSIKNEDINSILFLDTFNQLRNLVLSNQKLKSQLASSKSIRSYAFTDDSELLRHIHNTQNPCKYEGFVVNYSKQNPEKSCSELKTGFTFYVIYEITKS